MAATARLRTTVNGEVREMQVEPRLLLIHFLREKLGLTGAHIVATGSGGERTIAAAELFQDYMTTSLAPDDVLHEVRLPAMDGWGWGYEKFTRRSEDWAMVGLCALVKESGGTCEDVRIGLTNMGSTPLRASVAEEALRGQPLDDEQIAAAAAQAAEGTDPPEDLNASSEFKRQLARVLCERALKQAVG